MTSKGHREDSPLPPGLSQGPSRLVAGRMSTRKLDGPPRRVSLKENSRQERMVEGRPGNLRPWCQEPASTPAAAEPKPLCRAKTAVQSRPGAPGLHGWVTALVLLCAKTDRKLRSGCHCVLGREEGGRCESCLNSSGLGIKTNKNRQLTVNGWEKRSQVPAHSGPQREAQGHSRLSPTAPAVPTALECTAPPSSLITLTYLSLAQMPRLPGSPSSLLPAPRLGRRPSPPCYFLRNLIRSL